MYNGEGTNSKEIKHRKEAVRTDVRYGERYRSEVKSDGDTWYRSGLGRE